MGRTIDPEQIGREILIRDPFLGQVWLAIAKKNMESGDVALGDHEEYGLALFLGPDLADRADSEQIQLIRLQLWHILLDHWSLALMYYPDNRLFAALDACVQSPLSEETIPSTSLSFQYRFMQEHPELVADWAQNIDRVARYRFWRKPKRAGTDFRVPFLRKQAQSWSQMYGSDAGGNAQWYTQATMHSGEERLPWGRIMRAFVQRSGAIALRHTHRRPSRRYSNSPGLRKVRHPRLVVVVDTSASIGSIEWAAFFKEIGSLKRRGAHITILEADVMVQRTWIYHRGIPSQSKGGGGTAFDHAIRTAESDYGPDAIVYFTDGQGPVPNDWQGTPLLWVLTQKNDQLPGRTVSLSV